MIAPKGVDFSVSGPVESTAKKVGEVALKIILFPWGVYCATRWAVQRLIMIPLYPAQSSLVKLFIPQINNKILNIQFRTAALDVKRVKMAEHLSKKGLIIRHVCLEKNGAKLSGLIIAHPDHIQNGKWVLQACGNIQPIEQGTDLVAECYHKEKYNVLLVNNPGVGRSEGTATPDTIGDAQEMGIYP